MTKARHVFYSLHYDADRSRVAGILGSSALQGNLEAKLPEWDKIKRSGDFAIKRWIENALKGRSCCVVLIGAHTASRPWVRYEIRRSHELDLAMFGVYVHHLKDAKGLQSSKGNNPFEHPDSGLGDGGANVRGVLFFMLTGCEPFRARSLVELLLQVWRDPAPLASAFRRDVPAELDALLARSLDKSPSARPTLGEFRRALSHLITRRGAQRAP